MEGDAALAPLAGCKATMHCIITHMDVAFKHFGMDEIVWISEEFDGNDTRCIQSIDVFRFTEQAWSHKSISTL